MNKSTTNLSRVEVRDSDKGEILESFILNSDGTPYDLSGKSLVFNENKDGDKFVSDPNVSVVDERTGHITYQLHDQVHSARGTAWFDVIDKSNGAKIDSTTDFYIEVRDGLKCTVYNTTYISDLEKLKQQMEALIQQADGELKIELQRAEQQFNQELQNVFYPDVTEVKIDHINTGYIDSANSGRIVITDGNGVNGNPVYTDTIPVLPDEEYYIVTQNYWDGRAVNFLKQGQLMKTLPVENDAQYKFMKITIPHNIDGLVINGTRQFPPRAFKVNYYTQIPDSISSFVPILKNQDYNFEKVELTKKANYGYWDKNWGNFLEVPFDKTRAQIAYEPIKVKPFEIYKISGCSAWDARLWEIINFEGKIIDYCSTEKSNDLTETVMIPKNGAYLQINELFLDTHTSVEKAVSIKDNLPLSGKTWTAVGDSWTQLFSDQKKSYVNDVAEITGATAINSGGGGTGYIAGGPNNWNYQFYKHPIDSNSDIVTVFGSFNDAYDSNFKFGKQGDTDTNTLWGALKATLDHIYSSNFDAQVGIIAPGPWGAINQHLDATIKMSTLVSHSDSEVNDMPIADFAEKYVQILHDFAKLNSLPFLDLYHYSGLRPWDSTFINKHYHGTNDTDTTHPNSEAMNKFIAPKVAEFIKSFAI